MTEPDKRLTQDEKEEVTEHSPPAARVVHAAVVRQGDDELDRPTGSLFWSAVAAGIAIMTSVSVSGALQHYTPDAPWRHAIVSLGYPVGFLIVVLGRMQLFTEQTVVAILPLARKTTLRNLGRVAHLWAWVLLGNLVGTAAVAALAAYGHIQPEEILQGMIDVASRLKAHDAFETAMQGIPAGFIMAAIAWVRTAENRVGFPLVLVLTYAISLCGFAHVIAGSAEAWLLLWTGNARPEWMFAGFVLPALVGNVIGGTGMFAVLAHAQVRREI